MKFRLLMIALVLLSVLVGSGVKAQDDERGCPQRVSQEICIQVIVYGRNPGNGRCCQFANPCSVPPGWEVFFTQEECEASPI